MVTAALAPDILSLRFTLTWSNVQTVIPEIFYRESSLLLLNVATNKAKSKKQKFQVQMSQRVSKTRMFWLSLHGCARGGSLNNLHLSLRQVIGRMKLWTYITYLFQWSEKLKLLKLVLINNGCQSYPCLQLNWIDYDEKEINQWRNASWGK
jgi:hypothetical protein